MFLTLDGGDGCGKTTQLRYLAEKLQAKGCRILTVRDPGSTALGETLRNLLLNREIPIADSTEALLFSAARCQLIHEVIRPALDAGTIVLADRFLLSTFVYQCYAGGVPEHILQSLTVAAVGETLPDLGIVLDIPYEAAIKRIGKRSAPDRMERKGEEYHRLVREGFLKYAAADPKRYAVVDASASPEKVAQNVWRMVEERNYHLRVFT